MMQEFHLFHNNFNGLTLAKHSINRNLLIHKNITKNKRSETYQPLNKTQSTLLPTSIRMYQFGYQTIKL